MGNAERRHGASHLDAFRTAGTWHAETAAVLSDWYRQLSLNSEKRARASATVKTPYAVKCP
jgi:hypothetical protein